MIKLERKIKMKEGINPITDVCDDEVHDQGYCVESRIARFL